MKKSIILLMSITFLFQSCFSYRVIDKNSNFIANKKYKIKLSNKYQKVTLLSSTDSTITVNNNKNIETTISLNDIKKIKKRHFSYTKTTLLPVGVAVIGVVIILAVGEGNLYSPKTGPINYP